MRGTRRSKWIILMCRAACVLLMPLAACSSSDDVSPWRIPTSPTLPTSSAPANDFVAKGIVPVGGKPGEHTDVRIWGSGLQSGATVTFDGIATPATLDGAWLLSTAPPHPVGAIDIVVINPDGRTSRLEKAFTYVEDLLASGGDITIAPGESVAATLGPPDRTCGWDVPCRFVAIRAPADDMVEVELAPLDRQESIGLYTSEMTPISGLSQFPKQLTVRGGQHVWVMGGWALFSLTARRAK